MRTHKPYTNVTFTRRVDYDGGRKRAPRAAGGVLICPECGAVYAKGRWTTASDPRTRRLAAVAGRRLCRACQMADRHQTRGYLSLRGGFLAKHEPEIEVLLENEAARAAEDNPLGRILDWDRSIPGVLTVSTSTEHLVERLGRAVHRAFGGEIDYGFSHANKFAHAYWVRD
ncbi:MAG TPA: hypothetical protein VLT86_03730 [Vicinamibacterales bacterium]|nr:hypothetical protein [Vicinamibacterales bacterium]